MAGVSGLSKETAVTRGPPQRLNVSKARMGVAGDEIRGGVLEMLC